MLTEKLDGKHKFFVSMSFLAYVALAFPFSVQGSLAPVTMEFFSINATQQGFIMTIQSLGSLGAALFIALKGERYNKIHTIAFGLFVIGIMSAAIGFVSIYAIFLIMVVIFGFGNTFIDIMMNGVVSDVYPKKKNTLLPLVHAFFAVGAMLTPWVVTLTANPDDPDTFSRPFRVFCIFALAIGVLYLIAGRRIKTETPYINMDAMKQRVADNPAEVFKTKKAWFFLIVGILYFTFQVGNIMWLPTFTIRNLGVDFSTGGLILTLFFAGNLVMRFVGPFFFRVMPPRIIYAAFGSIAAVMMICGLFTQHIGLMFALVIAAGFMQGSSVAAFMLITIDAFPDRTASAASITTLSSGISTLTAPLWMGALSGYTGFLIPMIIVNCCLLLASALIFFKGK